MKKLLALALAGVMTVSMVACGNTDTKTNGESAKTSETTKASETAQAGSETAERTQLVVGFDASFPPYGYIDDETNEYVGFDLDLAAEVCERNGWELVKTPIDWDSKDMELNSGAIDCIWNGFTINGREDEYTWSDPYVDNSQVFVVAADSGIEDFEDLAGKVVLVQADSSALHALEVLIEDGDDADTKAAKQAMMALTASFAELQQVPEYNTAFLNMEAGAADAVAMDIGVAEYQIASRGDKFVILEETISSEQYGIGFKLGNEELRDQVQATLNEMVADGTFAAIAEEWGLTDSVCLGK